MTLEKMTIYKERNINCQVSSFGLLCQLPYS